MRRSFIVFFILSLVFIHTSSLPALKPREKYFKSREAADCYLDEHCNAGYQYYNQGKWSSAASHFEKVIFYFPSSEAAAEAAYYLGICYFEMKEYDFANEEFSNYLKTSQHPTFFEEAVYYKFCIAEHFKSGKKRRPFKMRYLPKWVSAQDSALEIYDEVIAALPNQGLAIQALYAKADLQKQMREFRDCIETYQTIIRRFPRHEIVPDCYLNIADAYLEQSRYEFQNPDILALAELNVRKFRDDFPRDEKVILAEETVCCIKELYANGLCDLGLFYERMKQPTAAAIYFQSAIEEFPTTQVAQFCRSRLICLGYLQEECSQSCDFKTIEEESPPSVLREYQGKEEASSPSIEEMYACEDFSPQDFVHYSLTKKREQQRKDQEFVPCEQSSIPCFMEGEMMPPSSQENELSPDLWHYSTIKQREQMDCQR